MPTAFFSTLVSNPGDNSPGWWIGRADSTSFLILSVQSDFFFSQFWFLIKGINPLVS